MKTTIKLTFMTAFILISLTFLLSSCEKTDAAEITAGDEKVIQSDFSLNSDCNCLIDPSPSVTSAEIEMLNFIREEEKLARDVYLAMYDLYEINIFRNIAKSEQNHMNQVLCLLEYYNLPDPASADTGVFTNPDLQALYDALILQGSTSLEDALEVGATIEDKDIFDLEEDMGNTANPAIINTFTKLSCASGNHLRSFSAWLTNKGISYTPQFISQEEYDGILSLPHQSCGRQ